MNATPQKIRVTEDMIINDMGIERVSNFFCEFDNDGDPLYGVIGESPKIHRRFDHWWIGETDLAFTVELDGIYHITVPLKPVWFARTMKTLSPLLPYGATITC